MKKGLLIASAAIFCLSVLTGCGNSRNSDMYTRDKSSQKVEQKGNVTIEEVKPEEK